MANRDWTPHLRSEDRPIYQMVAEAIAADIRAGRLAPGTRLPPQRRLAAQLGVDVTTISRAYNEARRQGLTQSRVGQGTFVARAASDYAPRLATAGPVDMSMNMPPLFSDRALTQRIWSAAVAIERDSGHRLLLRYQDAAGAPDDRRIGAEWMQTRVPDASPQRTLVAAGAQPAILAAIQLLAGPSEPICAEALTYPGLRAAAAWLGVPVLGVAMDEEGVEPGAFQEICERRGPKALYCTPTLHNPTTRTMSIQRRREIVRIARRYRVQLIEDDAYGRLPADPLPPLAALAPDITWHIAGLAKLVSPALRIAYVVAPGSTEAARFAAGLRAVTGMASPLTAALATRWIETGLAEQVLAAIRTETQARRQIAAEILGSEHAEPREAFHLWLPLPPGLSRASLQEQLARREVAVVPSDAFSTTSQAPEAVRIGLGATDTRETLGRALVAVAEVLRISSDWASTV